METLTLTEDDATSLRHLLAVFNHARTDLILQGNLHMDNVTLEWTRDIVRVSLIQPALKDVLEEG